MVRTLGFPNEFQPMSWEDISVAVDELGPRLSHLRSVVESVRTSGREAELVGALWMLDLAVAAVPVGTAPIDVIVVRAPEPGDIVGAGKVLIEHLSVSGRSDRIERPLSEVVPLFWRFIAEKYGIVRRPSDS